jgi:hypothetical protein
MYMIGPSPLTQARTCLSGEKCVVQDYVGFGLQNEDNLMILKNCGDPLALINHFPQGGISLNATLSGSKFEWQTYVTAGGGVYKLCWCASVMTCNRADMFNVDSGLLTMVGPYLGIDRTCKSGLECSVSGITGLFLQEGDRIRISNQSDQLGLCLVGLMAA